MLQKKFRDKDRRPFIIKGHHKFKAGVYKIKGKKLKRLQNFKPSRTQPKRNPWLRPAQRKYISTVDLRKLWGKQIDRVLKKHK